MLKKKIYESLEDFNEGFLSPELAYSTLYKALQLSNTDITFPYIWIPNNNGTVSKICTLTGNELGRYIVWPSKDKATSFNGPSRSAVDLNGNCWIANRGLGTVIKISSFYSFDFDDRNDNGICDSCVDSNLNGLIDNNELLSWGKDECVLKEIILFGEDTGPYSPGDYVKEYDSSIYPRALAIDRSNNLWVGTYDSKKYYKIDCESCEILSIIDLSKWNHHPYGAVIDRYGFLWSISGPSEEKNLLKIDTNKNLVVSKTSIFQDLTPYCISLDKFDHLFISGWTSNKLGRLNILTEKLDWLYYENMHLNNSRGITCTSDGDVWICNSGNNTVTRYSNDGAFKVSINVCKNPCALSVDNNGNVWVCGLNDESIYMIDSLTNKVSIIKELRGTDGHYAYSDMTGIIFRSITNKVGKWKVIYDSKNSNTVWSNISWLCHEPNGTGITVNARTSNDKKKWTNWENVNNNKSLTSICGGRYIEISVYFSVFDSAVGPTLSKLIVEHQHKQLKPNPQATYEVFPLDIILNSEIETEINIESTSL